MERCVTFKGTAPLLHALLPIPHPPRFLSLPTKSSAVPLKCTLVQCSPLPEAPTSLLPHADAPLLRDICLGHVPPHVILRVEEVGYVAATEIQKQALPLLLSGRDCVLHAQTGSGKTLAYLLAIFSSVDPQRAAVQALILVPTRELGIQVTKVARKLAAKPAGGVSKGKLCSVMALLDGGMLKRHKCWLKAEPPTIIVATITSLSQMLERQTLKLNSLRVLVVDEVDFMFYSSKEVSSVRKLLTTYSSCNNRQTILASASIPQHQRFLHDCMQQKWTKRDVVHVHVNSVGPMPACLQHRFVVRNILDESFHFPPLHDIIATKNPTMICSKKQRLETLRCLLQMDAPRSGIIFVGEQSEKSKKAGHAPSTVLLMDFLKSTHDGHHEIMLLEDDMNFNHRAASMKEMRQGGCFLLVATDIAARGVDLPDTTHIFNFELPATAVDYLHRAGRTGRKPFSDEKCFVTTIITSEEKFALQRYENELMFNCEEIFL